MANEVSDLRRQSEIDKFIDSLADNEHEIIHGCYESGVKTFDWALKWAIDKGPAECKKGIPSLKRFAEFERKYGVRLVELMGLPGLPYKGRVPRVAPSVRLPVAGDDEVNPIDVLLGVNEQMCLHVRDGFFSGSWEEAKAASRHDKASARPEISLPVIESLEQYEKKYAVDLGVILRRYMPLARENKKQKAFKGRA